MGYRIFRDSAGTEWQTWDVVPRRAERRVSDRRVTMHSGAPLVERRRMPERRVGAAYRPMLSFGMDGGWLCFEARQQKRRLAPIPTDWERCATNRLEEYCRAARPASRGRPPLSEDAGS